MVRFICIILIALAALTVIRSVMHVNDDYSYESVMGHPPAEQTGSLSATLPEATMEPASAVEEEPEPEPVEPAIYLSYASGLTEMEPQTEVTATFSDIPGSVQATLTWYLGGEPMDGVEKRLLVNGASITREVQVNMSTVEDSAQVELRAEYEGGSIASTIYIPVEREETTLATVRTEEIKVTCVEACSIYSNASFGGDTGRIMRAGETGLLLAYHNGGSGGLDSLELQFEDGTTGWVSARRNKITDEKCTTDEHYTKSQKMDFVNSMGYESESNLLIWVSLYTQQVSVFEGEAGDWNLLQSFTCASGVNETPTTTGIYALSSLNDRWDLSNGDYVEPVMVFNGGEAFTSQPKSGETGEITDDTMGEPASGGSVRLLDEDIQWLSENATIGTTVVVY